MKYILKLSFSVLLAHRFIRWVYKNLRNLRNPRLNICFSSSLWQKVVRKSVSICANLWPKAVSPRLSGETQTKNEKMKSKPNFKIATSHQISVFCTINPNFQAPHVSKRIKSKPNTKPKQSQSKPNPPVAAKRSEDGNPIRRFSEALAKEDIIISFLCVFAPPAMPAMSIAEWSESEGREMDYKNRNNQTEIKKMKSKANFKNAISTSS